MGWWEGVPFEPHTIQMIFDKNVAPLYGWMFPETPTRVNIGICIEGEGDGGEKTGRNVREVFQRFLDDHFRVRLMLARPVGRWKGHPIAHTTWIDHCHAPGVVYLGEAARITHNATGEGIYQAMQSGVYAAEAIAAIWKGHASEERAMRDYTWACRRRFTASFLMGHVVRGLVRTPLLDGAATLYANPRVRGAISWALGSARAGSHVPSRGSGGAGASSEAPAARAPVGSAIG
jgi:flavin-dependent dehydrogenase